jgi:hypothetical protein
MAEIIIYEGASGCGKSTSLRDLDPSKTVIISPNGKSLPFPKGSEYIKGKNRIITNELDLIAPTIQRVNDSMPNVNLVVIEDYSHYFTARILSNKFLSMTTGDEAFKRWNDFGASVFQSCFAKAETWREDLFVLILHHVENNDGTISFKTSGKLLSNVVDPVGYCNYVFHGVVEHSKDGKIRYMMQTNRDAIREAKTTAGCFTDLRVPNNMAKVIDRIRQYKSGAIKATFIE